MRASHILRKYDPSEWGGTETAVLRLLDGLRTQGVDSTVHCPRLDKPTAADPFAEARFPVRRFKSFLPVLGISAIQRDQLVRWGGNVMSFQLYWQLMNGPLDVIHSHALNRLAGVGLMVASQRNVPFVVTIHGGALDLPRDVEAQLTAPLRGGIEWGKALGLLVGSRRVLEKADAILACNPREAELLRERYPTQRILLQQHSVPASRYDADSRPVAQRTFPAILERDVFLCVARLDPVKNQRWLVEQLPAIVKRNPRALLVLAGPATSNGYGEQLEREVRQLGLQDYVLFTGALEPGSEVLSGLMQCAKAMLLTSTSETFGLTILEAWAAGTPIVSSRTSGACSLIEPGVNGWLFDMNSPREFHESLDEAVAGGDHVRHLVQNARQLVLSKYDSVAAATRVKVLYAELCSLKRSQEKAA